MPNRVRERYWPLLLVINSDHLQWPLLARCHINNISLYPFKWAIGVDRVCWRGNCRKGSVLWNVAHAFRKSFANCLMPLHWKRRPNCLTKLFKLTTLQTPDRDKWISSSHTIASSFEIKCNVPLLPRPLSQSTVFFHLALYSACSWMWQIPFIFQVLKVKIVKCDHHSLSRTLFSRQQTNIQHFFSLKSEKSQLWSFSISYSFQHTADTWQTSYIFRV